VQQREPRAHAARQPNPTQALPLGSVSEDKEMLTLRRAVVCSLLVFLVVVGIATLPVRAETGSGSSTSSSSSSSNKRHVLQNQRFDEELLVRSLPASSDLSALHFRFTIREAVHESALKPSGRRHFNLFPRALGLLVKEHGVLDARVSLGKGRWDSSRWGDELQPTAGGAELYARLQEDSSSSSSADADSDAWDRFTRSLSGSLLCLGVDQLPWTRTVAPVALLGVGTRYGVLPRETSCTENLSHWLKLLPTRSRAGLATQIVPSDVLRSPYHAMRIRIKRGCLHGVTEPPATAGDDDYGPSCVNGIVALELSMSLTYLASEAQVHKLGRSNFVRASPVATSSLVHIETFVPGCPVGDDGSSSTTPAAAADPLASSVTTVQVHHQPQHRGGGGSIMDHAPPPVMTLARMISENSSVLPPPRTSQDTAAAAAVSATGRAVVPPPPRCRAASSVVRKSLVDETGTGGTMVVTVENAFRSSSAALVQVVDVVPPFLNPNYASLRVLINNNGTQVAYTRADLLRTVKLTPGSSRGGGDPNGPSAVVELRDVYVPAGSSVTLSYRFAKRFLALDAFPADPNRGFDVPAAVAVFTAVNASAASSAASGADQEVAFDSLLLRHRAHQEAHKQRYSEGLLVMLPLPDFSMPYNVVTLSSTAMAFFFGTVVNILTRRRSEGKGDRPGLLKRIKHAISSSCLRRGGKHVDSSSGGGHTKSE
jgi:phosphatidylinositol glycan class T